MSSSQTASHSDAPDVAGRSTAGAAAGARDAGKGRAAAAFSACLTFEDVRRNFGTTQALAGVSLEIDRGEVVCLLGPSGCGKTTLLRIAAGIERPTGGRVLINGHEVAGPSSFVVPEKRSVGLMFQDFALFPHLTIAGNVAFGLKSLPRAEAKREALAALKRVGLEHMADEYPHVLSGGQQQRVALARALVPRPAVMLMDEPFSGLDVQLRDAMQEETLSLLRETGATAMVVTHNPEEAMRIGDRIVVMRAGRLIQQGQAEALYHQPADLFVARLFSEINEVAYRVGADGKIDTPIGKLAPPPGLQAREAVTIGIRERDIRLSENGEGLSGRVLDAKFLGDVVRLEVGIEGFDQPLKVRVRESAGFRQGQDVRAQVDPERALVFAAELQK
ncbi:ABC transporter ATP-binding protein [Hyphomicrobium sp. D-2]|uniref:ABC transporter ATP-binding protein n=1 Tax=Hyphomicrobium sp. D-2 TaxID=3041621 RepID=UPI002453EC19|nr:ABC transporter ATP-binding protein [Hyphomicrobium sp. D-2]MDH4982269.1 ABC transporter ATP-binding protein [Hyphomicrobium sp. D-2]